MRRPADVNDAVYQGQPGPLISAERVETDSSPNMSLAMSRAGGTNDHRAPGPLGAGADVQRVQALDKGRARFLRARDHVKGCGPGIDDRRAHDAAIARKIHVF